MPLLLRPFRFRYSVRTLLVATTVLGALLGLVGNEINRLRLHLQAERKVRELGGLYGSVSRGLYDPPRGPFWCPVIKDSLYADFEYVWFNSGWNEGLRDEDLTFLKHLPRLKDLQITAPLITDEAFVHIQGIKTLRELTLYKTHVTGRGLKRLRGTPLEKLVLAGPDITDETLTALKAFPGLRRLMITETSVTDVGLANLKHVPHLEKLIIDSSPVGDSGMIELANLTQLYELDVEGLAITNQGITPFAALPRLQFLNVAHTQVTETGLLAFRDTSTLKHFFIGPQPSADTLTKLNNSLPGCSVYDHSASGRCLQGW